MEPAPAVKPPAAPEADKRLELRDRLAVTILLIPFVLLAVADGNWLYLLALLTILVLAALVLMGSRQRRGRGPAPAVALATFLLLSGMAAMPPRAVGMLARRVQAPVAGSNSSRTSLMALLRPPAT